MVMMNPTIPTLLTFLLEQLLRVIFNEIRASHILEKKDDFNNVNKLPHTHNK